MKIKYILRLFWKVNPVVFCFAVFLIILSAGIAFFDVRTALVGFSFAYWMLLYLNEKAKWAIIFQKYMELLDKKEGE